MFDNIPEEMRRLPHWICWQLRDVDDGKGGTKQTKVPFRTDSKPASTTNPKDWVTFDAAVSARRMSDKFSGIGFVFTRDSGLVGIDLDKCRDSETGETEEWAKAILNYFGVKKIELAIAEDHVQIGGAKEDGSRWQSAHRWQALRQSARLVAIRVIEAEAEALQKSHRKPQPIVALRGRFKRLSYTLTSNTPGINFKFG